MVRIGKCQNAREKELGNCMVCTAQGLLLYTLCTNSILDYFSHPFVPLLFPYLCCHTVVLDVYIFLVLGK